MNLYPIAYQYPFIKGDSDNYATYYLVRHPNNDIKPPKGKSLWAERTYTKELIEPSWFIQLSLEGGRKNDILSFHQTTFIHAKTGFNTVEEAVKELTTYLRITGDLI